MQKRANGTPDPIKDEALVARSLGAGQASFELEFGGLAVTLDWSGAIYIHAHRTLAVSDLHLEKGSGAAARGRLLPALDSHDTLQRLRAVITRYGPERVVCLGDSFHDMKAGQRMAPEDKNELSSLCATVTHWVWIAGNHDPQAPRFCGGEALSEIMVDSVLLRHEPGSAWTGVQIAGHFHPKVSIPAGGYRFSGRCFSVSRDLMIMPAFGAYAGGLSCTDPVFGSLHKLEPRVFMLHSSKLWRVA